MREIKFRAWDKKKKVMFNRILDVNFCDAGIFTVVAEYNDEEHLLLGEDIKLMQFTGLQDKNGKEIWEGDVVQIQEYKGKHIVGKIVFNNEIGRFCFSDSDGLMWGLTTKDKFNEAIGNVHENPELLNK